jgi:hypothetical protein
MGETDTIATEPQMNIAPILLSGGDTIGLEAVDAKGRTERGMTTMESQSESRNIGQRIYTFHWYQRA